MSGTSARSSAAHQDATGFGRRALLAAAVIALPTVTLAQSNDAWDPQASASIKLDNPGDPNFNQLLGINDEGTIVGYFGDGQVVANNGYVLVPKNHYAVENYTHLPSGDSASETQAIGINNQKFPDIVGFYTDNATGFTHGFLDADGVQTAIDDPEGLPPNVSAPNQNLLAINDFGKAAGFWTDKAGHEHGYVVELDLSSRKPKKFIEIPPASFPGAVATQASDITDRDEVCGFWTDGNGNNHGFVGQLGEKLVTFNVKIDGATAASTSPFGCNNEGEIVGSYTDGQGAVHGFILEHDRFHQYDAAGSSQTVAFGVMGTFINGVTDEGDVVGFYSDGTKVNGFVRYAGGL
jgi:hypothetical protein